MAKLLWYKPPSLCTNTLGIPQMGTCAHSPCFSWKPNHLGRMGWLPQSSVFEGAIQPTRRETGWPNHFFPGRSLAGTSPSWRWMWMASTGPAAACPRRMCGPRTTRRWGHVDLGGRSSMVLFFFGRAPQRWFIFWFPFATTKNGYCPKGTTLILNQRCVGFV